MKDKSILLLCIIVILSIFGLTIIVLGDNIDSYNYLYDQNNTEPLTLSMLTKHKWDEAIIINGGYDIDSSIAHDLSEYLVHHTLTNIGDHEHQCFIVFLDDSTIVDVFGYISSLKKTVFTCDEYSIPKMFSVYPENDLFIPKIRDGIKYYVLSFVQDELPERTRGL